MSIWHPPQDFWKRRSKSLRAWNLGPRWVCWLGWAAVEDRKGHCATMV